MTEHWKPVAIDGWEDYYEVSDMGRLRRTATYVTGFGECQPSGEPREGYHHWNTKRRWVILSRVEDGEKYTHQYPLAHLVLFTFKGPCPTIYRKALHKDGDPTNCAIANLRWDIRKLARGKDGAQRKKLRRERARRIRADYASGGWSMSQLAARYHVDIALVQRIVVGYIHREA